jgi:ssRNA-specific RNase YbeY (16S rRNA maturation enzyme)
MARQGEADQRPVLSLRNAQPCRQLPLLLGDIVLRRETITAEAALDGKVSNTI